jgi:N-glycosylase/DNA lyase
LPSNYFSDNIFNPEITINSGQVFLWEKLDHIWYGTYGNHILKISQIPSEQFCIDVNDSDNVIAIREYCFESFPEMHGWQNWVFRLDDDIPEIFSCLSADPLIAKTISRGYGLRIMRQEPCQCMVSFVCSSNTNIIMIRKMLRNLSKKFGQRLSVDGRDFFTFPSIKTLHEAEISELRSCGVGYRAKAIKAVAKSIVNNDLDIPTLANRSYNEAKNALLDIYGIGNKIADCILLFSLDKLEAFPIDVWIARALERHYKSVIGADCKTTLRPERKLTPSQYSRISAIMRQYFGRYSGYAQQYLYYYIREAEGRKW